MLYLCPWACNRSKAGTFTVLLERFGSSQFDVRCLHVQLGKVWGNRLSLLPPRVGLYFHLVLEPVAARKRCSTTTINNHV